MQNKGIYTDISRNTIAIRAKSALNNPERRKQSAAEEPARTVSRYHAGAAMHHISRNRADRISPNRSRQTGAACHGQPAPDFSRLSGHGIAQPVQCSPIAMQGSAFCGFSALIPANCTKCLFVETHKTTKTAYLLAFLQIRGVSE